MRILLVQPGVKETTNQYPPLGLLYLASVVRGQGHEADLYDAAAFGESTDGALEYIGQYQPQVLGMSMYTVGLVAQFAFLRRTKQIIPTCKIVVGGPHATALPERTLQECPEIDVLVYGEGESTFTELLEAIDGGVEPAGIRGLCFRSDGDIRVNEPRPLIEDLDSLAFPAYDLVDKHKYQYQKTAKEFGRHPGRVLTSRGCPYRCTFCCRATFGNSYRRRSPSSVVAEIRRLVDHHGVDEIFFADDLFAVNRKWLASFYAELERENLRVPWHCHGRVDVLTKEDLCQMKSHGCVSIEFGVESGNDQVLQDICKGITLSQVREAFRGAREVGLETGAFFIIGNRLDDWDTVAQTIALAQELRPDSVGFSILTPFPGTQVYSLVPENTKYDWDRFDDYHHYSREPISICALSPQELIEAQERATLEFFGRPGYLLYNCLLSPSPLATRIRRAKSLWARHTLMRLKRSLFGAYKRRPGFLRIYEARGNATK